MEKELLIRAQSGDRAAFEQIYRQYRDYLLTVAAQLLSNNGWAEDVVQDVFVRFIDSLKTFQLRGSLKSYFAVCVANKARDLLRKQKIRGNNSQEAQRQVNVEAEPLKLLVQDEEMGLMEQGLATLPYDQREVIILRCQGGMTFREIALALDVPLKTAHSRWGYGLEKLRAFIREVDNV